MADKHRIGVGFKHPVSFGAGNDVLFITAAVEEDAIVSLVDMDGVNLIDMDGVNLMDI